MTAAPPTPLITLDEVARQCGVSRRTVQRWIARHGLAVVRVGRSVRVHPQDLEAFLHAHRQSSSWVR